MSFQCRAFYGPVRLPNPRMEETAPGRFIEVSYDHEPIYIPAKESFKMGPVLMTCSRCTKSFAMQRGHSCPVVTIAKLGDVE